MFNLLRRSRNKRSEQQRQNSEEPINDVSFETNASLIVQKPQKQKQTQPKPQPPQRRMHSKFTRTAIDDLEDFNDLEDTTRTLQEKQTTPSEEREACFAKIYFEDSEPNRNINLATNKTTTVTTTSVSKKPVSFVSSGTHQNLDDDDDVLNSATKQNSAKRNTKTSSGSGGGSSSRRRKSLGFRKVDLDGVNSVIEAILTNDGEYSSDHDGNKSTRSDGEQFSNVKLRTLSQNERAELSGHVSSQQPWSWSSTPENTQIQVCDTLIDQTESNVSKNLRKSNNNCESLLLATTITTTNADAGNVRNQSNVQNDKATTTKVLNTAIDTDAQGISPQLAVSSEESPAVNSKQIKAARRRSYFQLKSNETSTLATPTIKQDKDTEIAAPKIGALQKGKKLLSDIFMARGRHHHSNQRNQHNQTQTAQSTAKQPKQQQQQEPCKSQCNAAAVTIDHNNCQNAISNKDNTAISEIRNNITTTNNNHHNQPENKHIDRSTEPAAATTTTTMLRRHLETSNSTNSYTDPAMASTIQMTLSNNSTGKNASRRDVYGDDAARGKPQQARTAMRGNGLQHQRSNSAEHYRERREPHYNGIDNASSSKFERAYSEEPTHTERRRWSGASRAFERVPLGSEQQSQQTSNVSDVATKLTQPQQSSVIRPGYIEQNGTRALDINGKQSNKNNNNAKLHHQQRYSDEHGRKSSACSREHLKLSQHNQAAHSQSMGQTYAKSETNAVESRASTPREFRESQIPEIDSDLLLSSLNSNAPKVPLPKITVSDCSAGNSSNCFSSAADKTSIEQEIFYEFESEIPTTVNSASNLNLKHTNIIEIEDLGAEEEADEDDDDDDDEVFHAQVSNSQPAYPTYQRHHSPSLRHSPITLADVPEQEEDEANIVEDLGKAARTNVNDIDNEFLRRSRSRHANSASMTPERGPLKSCDSNLSNSYPDSGISGCSESLFDSIECNLTTSPTTTKTTTNNTKTYSARSSLPQQQQQQQQQYRRRSPFVRDSTSTDCDDTLLQCDDLDCFASPSTSTTTVISGGGERLVCIESISLPDVVESTTSSPGGGAGGGNGQIVNSASTAVNSGGLDDGGGSEHIININGATGNSMGNVHFIPIHVEGGERSRSRSGSGSIRDSSPNQQQPKRRSIDDNIIGSGMKGTRLAHLNGDFELFSKPTIEIVEEDDHFMDFNNGNKNCNSNDGKSEKLRHELQEQKSRFNAQLEDAHKNVQNLQTKINDMQTKIVSLEQELSTKTWNVERLQSELNATQREDEFVRKKLRLLEEEKTGLRQKYNESEDEFRKKFEELETEYKELQEKYKNTQKLASDLQLQLARAQTEAENWRTEVEKIRAELEEQIRILQNAFENSEAERKICEDKWQKEFEMLRTQHMDREETLMTDCEWQLRQMQKQWKDKLDKSEHARRDAVDTAELMGLELEARKQEVDSLRQYESEVKSLRGVVSEQHNCIQTLMDQIENLKSELHMANEKLEDQIEAVKKIKYQCDNALCDKERQMIYRIDEVRNEAASFWENKLHTEMTRLTHELESVYVDERREALDKLQAEHIEELRALTTRYTANEEELRIELNELQERYELKSQDFLELRQKSDNALLQTRMHLDRADREYQNAMCREEERREALEESLRKEFEEEKEEMEEKFRKRLEQVKEELIKELENSKQEMTQKHKKELEQQRAKLRAEKDQAMHELAERHRTKLAAAEDQIKESELRHQRDLNELKATYDEDKAVLDKRDLSNANEIEQLHRRCRCLTNLFEEMRMRYERRDPRPEDLREIEELRTRCDSQERDLFTLTTTLREMQMQMSNLQQNNNDKTKKTGKTIQKPPPKTIPTSCDVIYEENEERDSPPPQPLKPHANQNGIEAESSDEDNDDAIADDDEEEDDDEVDEVEHTFNGNNKLVNGSVSEVH